MKKLLPAVILAAILLSACGGPGDAGPAVSPTKSATTVAAPEITREPTAVTCEKFHRGGKNSAYSVALYTVTELLKIGPATTAPPELQLLARATSNRLEVAAKAGTEELNQLVKAVNEPFLTLISGSYDTSKMVTADHADAVSRFLAVCPAPAGEVTLKATPTPTPTPTVTADPVENVTYVVESDGSIDLVTYTHFIGGSTAQEQDSAPAGNRVEKSYTFKSDDMFRRYSFWSLGVSGMAGPDAGTISCSIILNGKVISTQTSTGAYANVMCHKGSSS